MEEDRFFCVAERSRPAWRQASSFWVMGGMRRRIACRRRGREGGRGGRERGGMRDWRSEYLDSRERERVRMVEMVCGVEESFLREGERWVSCWYVERERPRWVRFVFC